VVDTKHELCRLAAGRLLLRQPRQTPANAP
jgi:hypothetical protein